MPSALLKNARATAVVGVLVAGLLSGCATEPSAPDALAGAATASLARSTSIRCAGDATSKPAASRLVGYGALAGRSLTAKAASAAGKVVKLGAGTLRLSDFAHDAGRYDSAAIRSGGLVGAGIGRTTLRIAPHSSTKRKVVPKALGATNPLYVLRLAGSADILRGLTLRGTPQGHAYNGIIAQWTVGLRADHVRVQAIPGTDHQPPGETFAINDWRTTDSRWSHIRIDGAGVGASGFGVNSDKGIRICDAVAKNNPEGMGFAFWQSSGITCTDCRAYGNGFAGFNFERTSGTVTLVRPDARGNKYDMRIASDRRSARFRIIDPVLHNGVWTISMPRRWYTTNRQRISDISLIVHGVRRNDLLRIRWY